MVTRTVTVHTDDIDGTEGAETVRFSLQGTAFEIDLNEGNLGDLLEALHPYITKARKIGTAPAAGASRRSSTSTAGSRDYDPKVVRAWASENDVVVPARGRVPSAVIESWRQAHADV